ncbi:hypothetical protein JXA05_03480 [Candidatus Peregrinibacteria bacterium]|nr:hypothetical protein [Candidatus Peregrinibacteria bacterium]
MSKEQTPKIGQPEVRGEIERLTGEYLEKLKEQEIKIDKQKLLAMKVEFQDWLKTKGFDDATCEAAGKEFERKAEEAFADEIFQPAEIDAMANGVFTRLTPAAAKGKEGETGPLDKVWDKVKKALKVDDKSLAWAFAAVAAILKDKDPNKEEGFLAKTFRELAEKWDPSLKKTPEAAATAQAPTPEKAPKAVELIEEVKTFVGFFKLNEIAAKADYPKLQSEYSIDDAKAKTLAVEAVKTDSRLNKLYGAIKAKMGDTPFAKSILDLRFQAYEDKEINAMIAKINRANTKTDANFRTYLAAVKKAEDIEKVSIA